MDKHELKLTVERAKSGSGEDFERLYEEYRDRLFFFAVKNTGSREAAEDIVSETFVAAMEGIGSLREGEAFGGWLYSVAYKKCMDWHDSRSREVAVNEDQADRILSEPMQFPEDHAVSEQTRREIKEIIDSLPADQRSAVILYYYEEQSLAEVARSLGIKENAAKQRLFRARKAIKKGIEKRFGKDAVLMAVPLGAALNGSLDAAYAKASVSAGAHVKSYAAGVKIAAVGVIAAAAVSIPIVISKLGSGGDYRPPDMTASDEYVIDYNDSAYDPNDSSAEVKKVKREENVELGAYGEGRFNFLCDTPKINAEKLYVIDFENNLASEVTDKERKKCVDALEAVYGIKASQDEVETKSAELTPGYNIAVLNIQNKNNYSVSLLSSGTSFYIGEEPPQELYEPLGKISDLGKWKKYSADNYPDKELKMFDGKTVTIGQIIETGNDYIKKLHSCGMFEEGQDCFIKYILLGQSDEGTEIVLFYRMTRYGLEVDDGAQFTMGEGDALRMRAPNLSMTFVFSDRVTAIESRLSGKTVKKQEVSNVMSVGEAIETLEKGLAKNISSSVYEVGLMYCCPQHGEADSSISARPMWVFALSDPLRIISDTNPLMGSFRSTAYVDAITGDIYYYNTSRQEVSVMKAE